MILDIICFLGGLVLILGGANYLTDGATEVARRLRVSDLVIGLTIVAFGTSAPELAISMISAVEGNADISLGNVIGSNIFNILLVIGCVALVRPIHLEKSTLTKELPLVLLASLALFFCACDSLFDSGATNIVSRSDGLLLLCFFAIYMRYAFSIARNAPNVPSEREETTPKRTISIPLAIVFILGGLAALTYGGDILVEGASGIAKRLGVSDTIIALTIVAGGTSAPELATSVVAAIKNKPGVAVGNIVGSSIFNIFFIIGGVATIRPLNASGISLVDFGVLIGASVMFWLFGLVIKQRTITRAEGGFLVTLFIAYITYLIINS